MEDKEKPQLAIWEYRNSNEDFDRRIVMNVSNLMLDETKSPEEKQQMLSVMDNIVKSLVSAFDLMPNSPELDNRILSDSDRLQTEEK